MINSSRFADVDALSYHISQTLCRIQIGTANSSNDFKALKGHSVGGVKVNASIRCLCSHCISKSRKTSKWYMVPFYKHDVSEVMWQSMMKELRSHVDKSAVTLVGYICQCV